MISLLVLGANGRVGRLLRAAWAAAPPKGIILRWQSRQPLAPDWIGWSLADGAAALAHRIGPGVDVVLALPGITPAPGADYAANVTLAQAMAQAAGMAGAGHLLLASSAAVYGPPDSPAALAETSALAAAQPYGLSKIAAEAAARAAAGPTGLTALRIGNVAGTDMVFRAMLAATPEAPLLLDQFADGTTPSRSYIGPGSLAAGIASLAGQTAALPDALNIAAPGGVSMADLLAAMAAAGRPVPHRLQPAPATALRALHLDTQRLQSLHRIPAPEATAAAMVAQWLRLRGAP